MNDVLVVVGGIIPDVDIPQAERDRHSGHLPAGHADAGDRRLHHPARPDPCQVSERHLVTHKLLLADDSVTIQRVVELTFSGEDITW